MNKQPKPNPLKPPKGSKFFCFSKQYYHFPRLSRFQDLHVTSQAVTERWQFYLQSFATILPPCSQVSFNSLCGTTFSLPLHPFYMHCQINIPTTCFCPKTCFYKIVQTWTSFLNFSEPVFPLKNGGILLAKAALSNTVIRSHRWLFKISTD